MSTRSALSSRKYSGPKEAARKAASEAKQEARAARLAAKRAGHVDNPPSGSARMEDERERQRLVEQLDFRQNPENWRWSEKLRRRLESAQ